MTTTASLNAAARTDTGKGTARSLRRAGKVPAVIYGHGRSPEPLSVDTGTLTRLLATISAATTVVDVAVDDRAPVKALIREIQRDPLRSSTILHIDLFEIKADEVVTVEVPLHFVGTPDGVRNFGGILDQAMHSIRIEVLPGDIPPHVDVDVTALNIGQSLHVSAVSIAKAKILEDPARTICSVVAPRAEEVVAPAAEAVAVAEPELIRKLKPDEDGDETETKTKG